MRKQPNANPGEGQPSPAKSFENMEQEDIEKLARRYSVLLGQKRSVSLKYIATIVKIFGKDIAQQVSGRATEIIMNDEI